MPAIIAEAAKTKKAIEYLWEIDEQRRYQWAMFVEAHLSPTIKESLV